MKIGVLKFSRIVKRRATRNSGRKLPDENLGLNKILSELKHDHEFCYPANLNDFDYVLVSLCSFYDVLNLIANVPEKRGKTQIIAGGPGVSNINPILDYIDIANFGRCDMGKVNKIIEGENFKSVWRKTNDRYFEDEYEVDLSSRAGLGDFEKGLGCRKKCAFCFYSWWNNYIGSSSGYDDIGGNEDFITHADFSKHLVLTAIDGMTEKTRFRVGKNISCSDIETALLSLNNHDKHGAVTTANIYSVIGYEWENKEELLKCDLIPICSELDAKMRNRLNINLRLGHFVPCQKTPLWSAPFNCIDFRRVALANKTLFDGRKIKLIVTPCVAPSSAAEETIWHRSGREHAELLKLFSSERYRYSSARRKIDFLQHRCADLLSRQKKESIANIQTRYKY